MGKRSRKRATGPVRTSEAAPTTPPPAAPRRKSRVDRYIERADERPKPPWHPVPLIEISVLLGLALIVIGFINSDDPQGRLAIVFGLVLASLAGLDTAARDHFGGFRSHSSLLAAMPAVFSAVLLGILEVQAPIILPVAVVIFAIAFFYLRNGFKRRTGVGFKV